MSVVAIPDELDSLVGDLARETGQSKADVVRAALEARLHDLYDVAMARDRLSTVPERVSLAEVKRQLGLDD